jgi:hypothetical protein
VFEEERKRGQKEKKKAGRKKGRERCIYSSGAMIILQATVGLVNNCECACVCVCTCMCGGGVDVSPPRRHTPAV